MSKQTEDLRSLMKQLQLLTNQMYLLGQSLVQKSLEIDLEKDKLDESWNKLIAHQRWPLPITPN